MNSLKQHHSEEIVQIGSSILKISKSILSLAGQKLLNNKEAITIENIEFKPYHFRILPSPEYTDLIKHSRIQHDTT